MQTSNTRKPTAAQARQARRGEIIYGLPAECRRDYSFAEACLTGWAQRVTGFYDFIFAPLDPERHKDNEPYQELAGIEDELGSCCRNKSRKLELIAAGVALLEQITPEILSEALRHRSFRRRSLSSLEWEIKGLLRDAQSVCTAVMAEGSVGR